MAGTAKKEVLIAFHQQGNAVNVTTVDPETLTEVSIVGSPAAGEETLKRTAIRKHDYVIETKRKARDRRA